MAARIDSMRALVIAMALATSAGAQPASTAERLYEDGQRAYDEKRYDNALASWKQSYELSRLPGLLYNLAQAYRLRAQAGDCALAVANYKKFIELDPRSPERANAEGFLVELKSCDIEPALREPPPGSVVREVGHGKQRVGGIVAGAGFVSIALGLYFGAQARALGDEVTEECADGCDFVDIAQREADGRSAATKQWVFLGVGAVGLATGGVLYWLGRRERRMPAMAVVPRGDGAVVTWSRAW